MRSQAKRSYQLTDIPESDLLLKLTPRQVEVLKWVAKGKTNMQIAKQIGVSEKTIKNHRYNIGCKLGLKGRSALFHFSLKVFGISIMRSI